MILLLILPESTLSSNPGPPTSKIVLESVHFSMSQPSTQGPSHRGMFLGHPRGSPHIYLCPPPTHFLLQPAWHSPKQISSSSLFLNSHCLPRVPRIGSRICSVASAGRGAWPGLTVLLHLSLTTLLPSCPLRPHQPASPPSSAQAVFLSPPFTYMVPSAWNKFLFPLCISELGRKTNYHKLSG